MLDDNGDVRRCPECGKICYTEREAGAVLNRARRRKQYKGRKKYIPRRYYMCEYCGCWHTTHQIRTGHGK